MENLYQMSANKAAMNAKANSFVFLPSLSVLDEKRVASDLSLTSVGWFSRPDNCFDRERERKSVFFPESKKGAQYDMSTKH